MTFDRLLSVAISAATILGSTGTGAAEQGRGSAAPASQLPARSAPPSAAPLKGELRVNPGTTRVGAAQVALPQTSVDVLTQKFNEMSGKGKAYEAMAKAIPDIAKQCSQKAYSVQDQKAAGCAATDSVQQCTDKLVRHCIENFSSVSTLPGIGLPSGSLEGTRLGSGGKAAGQKVGFSTKEFQQTAQAAAADARALSQLLNLYASQVEQGAKALLP